MSIDKKNSIEKGWHEHGQWRREITYFNGQAHELFKHCHLNGSLEYLSKWHQDQWVWEINSPSKEHILEDAKVELFFQPTPEFS